MSKILFIAPHPDDETLGCGGTILKHKKNGDSIFWLIITEANQKIEIIKNFENIRKEYIRKVSQEYAFDKTFQLSFLTTELDTYPLNKIIGEIKRVFFSIQPEIIYLPNRTDVQSDHRIVFDAVYSCTKSFRAPYVKKVLMYETLSETEFTPSLHEKAFIPNYFIDITPYLKRKLEIMKIFTSELMEDLYPRTISTMEALARYRGSRIGVKFAEAFYILFEKN